MICVFACVCAHVPAICKEELQVSHVDLPQGNTVALCQRQRDSVHAVIQCPKHMYTHKQRGRKRMIKFHLIKAERAITPTHMHM